MSSVPTPEQHWRALLSSNDQSAFLKQLFDSTPYAALGPLIRGMLDAATTTLEDSDKPVDNACATLTIVFQEIDQREKNWVKNPGLDRRLADLRKHVADIMKQRAKESAQRKSQFWKRVTKCTNNGWAAFPVGLPDNMRTEGLGNKKVNSWGRIAEMCTFDRAIDFLTTRPTTYTLGSQSHLQELVAYLKSNPALCTFENRSLVEQSRLAFESTSRQQLPFVDYQISLRTGQGQPPYSHNTNRQSRSPSYSGIRSSHGRWQATHSSSNAPASSTGFRRMTPGANDIPGTNLNTTIDDETEAEYEISPARDIFTHPDGAPQYRSKISSSHANNVTTHPLQSTQRAGGTPGQVEDLFSQDGGASTQIDDDDDASNLADDAIEGTEDARRPTRRKRNNKDSTYRQSKRPREGLSRHAQLVISTTAPSPQATLSDPDDGIVGDDASTSLSEMDLLTSNLRQLISSSQTIRGLLNTSADIPRQQYQEIKSAVDEIFYAATSTTTPLLEFLSEETLIRSKTRRLYAAAIKEHLSEAEAKAAGAIATVATKSAAMAAGAESTGIGEEDEELQTSNISNISQRGSEALLRRRLARLESEELGSRALWGSILEKMRDYVNGVDDVVGNVAEDVHRLFDTDEAE